MTDRFGRVASTQKKQNEKPVFWKSNEKHQVAAEVAMSDPMLPFPKKVNYIVTSSTSHSKEEK